MYICTPLRHLLSFFHSLFPLNSGPFLCSGVQLWKNAVWKRHALKCKAMSFETACTAKVGYFCMFLCLARSIKISGMKLILRDEWTNCLDLTASNKSGNGDSVWTTFTGYPHYCNSHWKPIRYLYESITCKKSLLIFSNCHLFPNLWDLVDTLWAWTRS